MSKKLATILFIAALAAPPLVTYTWLSMHKSSLKHKIKKQLAHGVDEDQLVRLTFSKSAVEQLKWEHSAEFEYKGEMYDVVRSEEGQDSITYYCWWDNEETALNRQLSTLLEEVLGTNSEREDKQNLLISYFKSVYYHDAFSWQPKIHSTEESKMLSMICSLVSVDLETYTPPPRIS